ncbi:hypothetical protein LZ30DRAFT_122262 [Colletotrichum cereale]|nr:hypothetical protein LZ30DRAFT_122262 [Colletotrichum cereale]
MKIFQTWWFSYYPLRLAATTMRSGGLLFAFFFWRAIATCSLLTVFLDVSHRRRCLDIVWMALSLTCITRCGWHPSNGGCH